MSQAHKLPSIPIRIPAVNGKDITLDDTNTTTWCRTFCTPSMIGCYLSHLEAWKQIANGDSYGLVLEDDIDIVDDFNHQLEQILQELCDRDWGYINLGGSSLNDFALSSTLTTIREDSVPILCHCYLLTKEAAQKLIKHSRAVYHVDVALIHILKEEGIKHYTSKPLATQSLSLKSSQSIGFPYYIGTLLSGVNIGSIDLQKASESPIFKIPWINENVDWYLLIWILLVCNFPTLYWAGLLYILLEVIREPKYINRGLLFITIGYIIIYNCGCKIES
jgi:hypothetical protein